MNSWVCLLCGAEYPTVNAFVSHVSTYPDSEEDRFKCILEGCIMTFSSAKSLEKHMNNHVAKGSSEFKITTISIQCFHILKQD